MRLRDAFLADIRDWPDDDAPRLIFADWLDDNGQPERAEFIRVQVELARLDPTDDRYPELHLRQLQLLAEHEREWLGLWADRLVRWRFQRGMLHEITVQPEPFVAAAELFACHPVHTVAFVDAVGETLATAEILRVVAVPHFALVHGLELSGCRPGESMFGMFGGEVDMSGWLASLARAVHATRLELVSLPGGTRRGRGYIHPDAFAAFCSAPHLASLRSLDLSDVYTGEGPQELTALCRLLAGATFAAGLRKLSLAHLALADDALTQLTASAGLRNLEAVDLTSCDALGADALGAFLRSRPRGRLTDLGLPYGLGLRELGEWPGLGDVRSLRLSGTTRRQGERSIHYSDGHEVRWASGRDVGEDEWLGLFCSPHFRPTRLGISAETVPDEALAELFRREWVSGLRSFDLGTNQWRPPPDRAVLALLLERDTPYLHEVGLPGAWTLPRRLLAAWPALPRLTRFELGLTRFDADAETDFTTWLLDSAPLTPRLARIDLDERCKTDAAVRALAGSAWARGACHLGFAYNDLTPEKVARLAAAPFAPHLEALHLGSEYGPVEPVVLDALAALADERCFPRLRDVVVGSAVMEEGIEVLRRRFGARLRVWCDY
jgi:uncharacterized protein (TIGR02996 family)